MMEANSTVGLVILVVVVVLLGVGVPAFFIWGKIKWLWPEGNRVSGKFRGVKATIIFSDEAREAMRLDAVSAIQLAKDCAAASWCTMEAWVDVGVDPSHDPSPRLRHVVVRFATDIEYDGTGPDTPGNQTIRQSAANLSNVGVNKRVGSDTLPLVISRAKYRDLVQENGEPVIHELCHQLILDAPNDGISIADYKHLDDRVWASAGGEATVQGIARKTFEDLKS